MEPFGDVVVLVPGIGGSTLERDGRTVWGVNPLAALRARTGLALAGDGSSEEAGTSATAVLKGAAGLPGIALLDLYGRTETALCTGLGLERGLNYQEFPYDWRLDNRVAARRLAAEAPKWLHRWRSHSGNTAARLVLVGHSMGGLVARYAVEVLGLWQHTAAVVTIGTPHRGTPKAARTLAHGLPGLGLASRLTEALRSMPSVHQLLPVYPCVTVPGARAPLRLTALPEDAALAGLRPAAVRAGEAFLREIQWAATVNRSAPAYRRQDVATYAVAGVRQSTVGMLEWTGGTLRPHAEQPAGIGDGDGTVPHPPAYPIEWDTAPAGRSARVAGRHTTLAAATATLDQVVWWLRRGPDLRVYRGAGESHADRAAGPGPRTALALDCPEIVEGDVLEFSAHVAHGPDVPLVASVRPADGSAPLLPPTVLPHGHAVLPRPAPGWHRVTVAAADGSAEPLSDLVLVLPDV
jgi:hypothetical protein